MDTVTSDFFIEITKIIDYIARGYEIRARAVFDILKDDFSHGIRPDTELQNAVEIWVLLDEYLNAEVMDDDFKERKKYLLSAYEGFLEGNKTTSG